MKKKILIRVIAGIVLAAAILGIAQIAGTKRVGESRQEQKKTEETETAQHSMPEESEAPGIQMPEEIKQTNELNPTKEQAEDEESDPFGESAIAFVIEADEAIDNMLDKLEAENMEKEEVCALIGEYFDETLTDYVLFLYQIEEKDGGYTHVPYSEYNHFWIYIDREYHSTELVILNRGDNWCEVGLPFRYSWRLEGKIEEEIVPVRLEIKDGAWKIVCLGSQWYNDLKYYYMQEDDIFDPEYFTKEQAEELVKNFGTDEDGNKIQICAQIDEEGCFFKDSSSRLISDEELDSMSKYEAYLVIQEIYARHGKKFSVGVLEGNFSGREWYVPYEQIFANAQLSEIEEENIRKLTEKHNFTWEADRAYGSLYPVSDDQEMGITEEEAACMVYHAFAMADEVISFKEENFLAEESDDTYKPYSLGEYSDEESLKQYLSGWFDEGVFDYLVAVYSTWNCLWKDENGEYRIVADALHDGEMLKPYFFRKVRIIEQDENRMVVAVPFYDAFGYDSFSMGEFTFEKREDKWIITEISHPYYDEYQQTYNCLIAVCSWIRVM